MKTTIGLESPYKCLNVLGNELRVKIIELLKQKPLTVQEICEKLNREQSAVSHSLQQLRKCRFVDYRKKGKEREYYLQSNIFKKGDKPIFELIEEHVRKNCLRDKIC